MVNEIRIYVEGGGEGSNTKAMVRQGFSVFLRDLVGIARSNKVRWQIIACGSRNATSKNFQTALRTHQDAFNILLVDSEGPLSANPRQHLQTRDGWSLHGIADEQCHLMVQATEAWLIADIDTLEQFYGQGFIAAPIPKNLDVEQIEKRTLYSSLKAATRMTTKGEYHKIHHGPKLLERLNVSRVRSAARHCDRLFTTLAEKMDTRI